MSRRCGQPGLADRQDHIGERARVPFTVVDLRFGVTELLAGARAVAQPPSADVGTLVCDGRAIDLLGLRVTLKRISGTEPGPTGSVRKLLTMRNAQRIAELCFAMSGAGGAVAAGAGSPV